MVDRRRGVGRAGESLSSTALIRRSGFWLAIAWVGRRQDVGMAIGLGQRCGSIGSRIWWSETAWVSGLESLRTASVD